MRYIPLESDAPASAYSAHEHIIMVYLLHFDLKISDHAYHYVGYCESGNLDARMTRHRAGRGGRLVQVLMARGGDFVVARVWPEGTKALERKLKRRKNHPKHCPICRAKGRT